MSFDKTDISSDGRIKAYTRFIKGLGDYFCGRKVVAVEGPDGKVEVRYDQEGTLEGKVYRNMVEFEEDAYQRK